MAITQAVCTSFKQELLVGTHDFTATTGDTFKIALYTSSASLDATTTAYSSSNEVSNSGTYTATGGTLTSVTPTTSGTTAICDFSDISFTQSLADVSYNDGITACIKDLNEDFRKV